MENKSQVNNNQTNTNANTNIRQTTVSPNEKMAVRFPDWDLLPPALLVRREKHDS